MVPVVNLNKQNTAQVKTGLTAEDFFKNYIEFSDGSIYKVTKVESCSLGYNLYLEGSFIFVYNKELGVVYQIK